MKTKEEILDQVNFFITPEKKQQILVAMEEYATQCQEDMADKKYTEEDLINFAHFYFQENFNSTIQTCKSTQQILQEWFNSLNKQD